jgi:DNA invertase Pin-like site-specific DNA recombinase
MNCAIYARISNNEQISGYSIATQLEKCRELAASQNWPVVAEYVDLARSGTDDQRPEFQRMIRAALTGQFQTIIVYSFDRFARNIEHAIVYKSLLRREGGVQVVSVIEPVDKESPFAFIQEGLIDLFAAFYSINLSAKTRAGQEKAVKQGRWPKRPPFGYKRSQDGIEPTEIGPQITWAFSQFATGKHTLESWADTAYQKGIRNLSGGKLKASHWSYIFNNPFYVGVLSWNGQEFPGLHQPLIDRTTFDQVQAVLRTNENNVVHRAYRSFILRGLLYSLDADSIMTGATATGKGGKYEYYRSRAKTPAGIRHHVPAKQLETQITAVLKNVGINDNDLERMRVDEVLRLALQAAPTVGAVYKCLRSDEQRRGLLKLVVAQYGFKVSGLVITQVEPLAPFCLVDKLEVTKRE